MAQAVSLPPTKSTPPKAKSGNKVVTSSQRVLRVALVWNGAIQGEETLFAPRPVVLGFGKNALFPLPAGVGTGSDLVLLEPSPSSAGYQLKLSGEMGGYLWLDGQRTPVSQLRGTGVPVALGPNDYGVVTLGTVAFFFQHVRAAVSPARRMLAMDGAALGSFGLSIFLHVAGAMLLLLAQREMPAADPLELPTDLVRKFLVTPPPEDVIERNTGGTNTEDPGLRDREEMGGKKAAGDEGRVGERNAKQENTEIQGENNGPVAANVRKLGTLGVLSGGGGRALSDALNSLNVGNLLSGLNSNQTVMGVGSGGMGLRGQGSGGGGTGPGVPFGAGNMGTGIGAGSGSGHGRGSGGIGVKGRPAREIGISMRTEAPRVNGYLSPEQINRVVRANSASIRYCYENEVQRQPNLRGRIEIEWRINLQGMVTTARVASSTMGSERVEGCMVRYIRRWRFDQPDGGEVVVRYPFIFGVQGG